MWKNKEIRWGSVVSVIILMINSLLLMGAALETWKKLFLAGSPVLLFLIFLCMSLYRHKKVCKYTEYLNQIQNGEFSVPLQENEEGELSILQNEVYKVTRRLMEQTELLSEKTNFLSDSLSNISHQLKTPVTSLLMMADLLQEPNLPEEKRIQFTQNITTGLERMQWLVQGLLMLAKLDAESIAMKRDMVRVSEVIQASLRHLELLAEEKNISILIEGDDNVTYTGDFAWSLEAFSNIIKNCIEHTEEGKRIYISYVFNSLSTSVTIRDEGEGIGEKDLYHIFERFYKGENASNNSVGIGLALAKEIITRQKGTIAVSSEVGKGTEFYIKFYEQ